MGDELKKEVIGGYILFPGDGNPLDVEVSHFYKTIGDVNIGAFPLRPKDKRNRYLLVNFVKGLIDNAASEILSSTIPQKGLKYENVNFNYLIAAAFSDVGNDLFSLKNGSAKKFIFGKQGPAQFIDFSNIKYLVPVIDHYLTGYYEIKSVKIYDVKDQGCQFRFEIELGKFNSLNAIVSYGINDAAIRGIMMKSNLFNAYCSYNAEYEN